jgi:hypothetical protein
MEAQTAPQQAQKAAFSALFEAGGFLSALIILLGLLLVVWGVLNLALARSRIVFLVHGLLCFVPLLLGLAGMCRGYSQFAAMVMSPAAPKPVEVARTMSFAMASGIFGSIATMVPAALCFIAIAFKAKDGSSSLTENA